ncbi:MAG TPA: adenylate/guanylate cyclase domain-containing protein [Cyclobacteriaceae bacterium]
MEPSIRTQTVHTRSEVGPHRSPTFATGKWRQAVWITASGSALGLAYPVFGDGFASVVPFINGFVIGFTGGMAVSLIELFLLQSARKRMTFLTLVLIKSLLYTAVVTIDVFTVILVSRAIQWGYTLGETLTSEPFRHFLLQEDFVLIVLYSLTVVFIVIFLREINRKLGQGVLLNFISGRYFRPRLENRIFMFLDLNDSVGRAESLGDMAYHNLLNDFFHDITEPIMMSGGKIHHYVGDEVVVSWILKKQTTTDKCLLAYLHCRSKLASLADKYQATYGLTPHFKGALHCGPVICGEVGEVKSEIVFHGDTVNATARLERMCSEMGKDVLISAAFHARLSPQWQSQFRLREELKLRGRQKTLQVYEVAEPSEIQLPRILSSNGIGIA